MKSNLWTFGDSFIECLEPNGSWISMLASDLNMDHKSFGCCGSSLDYTYFNVRNNCSKFLEDDIIIVVLTQLDRQWIIEDEPEIGTLQSYESFLKNDKTKLKFIVDYFISLNIDILELRLENFLCFLEKKTAHLKIKPIVFSCFDDVDQVLKNIKKDFNLNIVDGNLAKVSRSEFSKLLVDRGIFVELDDHRLNHLSQENHTILKSKILDFILDNKLIILDNFKEDIIHKL